MSVIDPDFLLELNDALAKPSKAGLKASLENIDEEFADAGSIVARSDVSGAVSLNPVSDNAAVYVFAEALTDNATISLVGGAQTRGRVVFIQRSGINGAYAFTVTGLSYGGDITLTDGQALALLPDGSSWRAVGLLPLALSSGNVATVAWEEVVVTGSTTLTAADHSLVYAVDGQIRYRLVKVERGSDVEAVLSMQNNPGALAAWRVSRRDAFASAIKITRDTAGSINGGTEITIGPSVGDVVDIWLDKQETGPDVPTYRARGDIAGSTTLLGELDANGQEVYGNTLKTGTVSGLLSDTHKGGFFKTSGNVTAPVSPGFHTTLKAGGAHTVTFDGASTAALTTGDRVFLAVDADSELTINILAAADMPALS